MAGREDVIRYFRDRNDYRDKELRAVPDETPDGEAVKCIVVAYAWGETVRLKGGDPMVRGFVTCITARPGSTLYDVSWPDNRSTTQHYDFELEAIDPEAVG